MDAYARSRLRSAVDRRGLKLAAVAGYTDFCAGYDHPDVPLHEAQITYVAEMARLAHDLRIERSKDLHRI
jgi:sugar phosphate isomerase/epimerase